jgi:hypothetical protein
MPSDQDFNYFLIKNNLMNQKANSADPDKITWMCQLIWIYTVHFLVRKNLMNQNAKGADPDQETVDMLVNIPWIKGFTTIGKTLVIPSLTASSVTDVSLQTSSSCPIILSTFCVEYTAIRGDNSTAVNSDVKFLAYLQRSSRKFRDPKVNDC